MYTKADLLNDFEAFNSYVLPLKSIEESLFFEPIAEGKWSIAEIISHMTFWDQYIREEMLPQMKTGVTITSVDFDAINIPASEYALISGSQQHLLDRQLEERGKLVSDLRKKTEEELFAPFTLNGEEVDQYSGYPHSVFSYVAAFVWHDNHHRKQIDEFLAVKHISDKR